MKKEVIKITFSKQEKIKRLKRLARQTVGLPPSGQVIRPKKGGPYVRRAKHQKPLSD